MDLVAPGSEEAMLPLWGPLARQLRGVRRVWDSRGGEVRASDELPGQVDSMHQSTVQQAALYQHTMECGVGSKSAAALLCSAGSLAETIPF